MLTISIVWLKSKCYKKQNQVEEFGIKGVRIVYIYIYIYIYISLSRVRTFQGLFICKQLNDTKMFDVDSKLLLYEQWLQYIEQELVNFLNVYFSIKLKCPLHNRLLIYLIMHSF